jgi:hypothetical protein
LRPASSSTFTTSITHSSTTVRSRVTSSTGRREHSSWRCLSGTRACAFSAANPPFTTPAKTTFGDCFRTTGPRSTIAVFALADRTGIFRAASGW